MGSLRGCLARGLRVSSLNKTQRFSIMSQSSPETKGCSSAGAKSPAAWLDLNFRGGGAGFTTRLPGWSADDVNQVSKDLRQMPYLRTWRVLPELEVVREMAKPRGFLDLLRFEDELNTYMKCVDLERLASYADLDMLNGKPYGYNLLIDARLGRVGKTSFQIDNDVRLEATGAPLFRSSMIYVCVEKNEVKVCDLPEWWTRKYRGAVSGAGSPPLRVSLPRKPGISDAYDVVYRCRYQVRATETDRFGHANNTALLAYCADALTAAHERRHLRELGSQRLVEGGAKKTEVDFIEGSSVGETVTASVLRQPSAPTEIFIQLHNNGRLVMVQKIFFDPEDIALSQARSSKL